MAKQVEFGKVLAALHIRRAKNMAGVCRQWLEELRGQVKPSTLIRYETICVRHLVPELGSGPVQEIGERQITAFIQRVSGELSGKTVRDILSVLRNVLRYAQRIGAYSGELPGWLAPRASRREMRVLSREEQRLLELVLPLDEPRGAGILLCLYTGLRLGEACALTWGDVDLTEGTVAVRRTVQRLPQQAGENRTALHMGPPKTACSCRKIPLPPFLTQTLMPLRGGAEDFVLTGTDKPMQPRTYQYIFKRYLERAGVADANFHALRHTFATRCVESGFDPKSLSEILGHASVSITMNRYVHASLDWKRQQMSRLQAMT